LPVADMGEEFGLSRSGKNIV